MDKEKNLYESFTAYIETCEKLNNILWDSIALEDLLKSNIRHTHFINKFTSAAEYKNLLKAIEDWDAKKPNKGNISEYYLEYHQYNFKVSGCVSHFFTNSGMYDIIISGRGSEINKGVAFAIFLTELKKERIEVLRYGEIFPLKIEMRKDQILEFGEFCFLTEMDRYSISARTRFVFLLRRPSFPQHLGSIYPYVVHGDDGISIGGETPFSVPLFILNLYFEKPLYIPKWYESHSNRLSREYKPQVKFSKFSEFVSNEYFSDLNRKYRDEAFEYASSGEEDYTDWDRYDEYIFEKEEEFIKNGCGPVNYLSEVEIEKFRKFIDKTNQFLKSDLYKKARCLQLATHYYIMSHERPDIADDLVNNIIALESLYFSGETSEMKEKLANRIANLLGATTEIKSEIRKNMLDLYNLRCKYIHGKTLDKNNVRLNMWLRNILRVSLLSFFSLHNYYNSNDKREELLENLTSVFDIHEIEKIRIQASDFLILVRQYEEKFPRTL